MSEEIDFIKIEKELLAKKYPGFAIVERYRKGKLVGYNVQKDVYLSSITPEERTEALIASRQ